MPLYQAPLRDQHFVIHELLQAVPLFQSMPRYQDLDADTLNQVLDEAAKFAQDVLLPINRTGDEAGCAYDASTHGVATPRGFSDAFNQYRDAGWQGLIAEVEDGGQALPQLLEIAFGEMRCATNQAWSMYPGLALGAYECIRHNGSEAQKALYLPKLVSAQWGGTMCLTEPHCGTDLGLLRTKAIAQADGSYRITGNKIFISAGEHDLTENIVHLVLARLPDAPAGTRGISLFIVPKFLPVGEGAKATSGQRNGVYCGGIEHKMGINANATCQMVFENAQGWLLGEPNKGLQAMFVMMNSARLATGIQGLGLNEAAYQNAVSYARQRVQGRSFNPADGPESQPIVAHPDVRRLLLTARAYAEGGRAFAYWVALMADQQHHHPEAEQRAFAADMMALMTPLVKAFLTDNGFFRSSECLQVFGGHGYIREWGMEQFVRDARIGMIYEGTNAIQSLDLLGRKILMDQGARLKQFGALVQAFVDENGTSADMDEFVTPLADLAGKVQKLTMELGLKAMAKPDEVGAASVDYLRVLGHLVFAYFWARMALLAVTQCRAQGEHVDPFYLAKLATARFYFARLLPETAFHIRAARSGAASILNFSPEWL